MSDPRFEVENEEIQALLRELGRKLKANMPAGWGFTLLIFNYGRPDDAGAMFYLSSAMRGDMCKALREFLAKNDTVR